MLKIAVLLAAYNGEKYILELLESINRQTYRDFICYIHDDDSTDKTASLCKEFCKQHKDRFIFLDYPGTHGAKDNFFSLMKRVEADYVFFCDQDDLWLPEKIEKLVNAAQKNRKKQDKGCLVFSDLKVVDEQLRVKADSFFSLTKVKVNKIDYKNSLVKGYIPGCSIMIDRELLHLANRYEDLSNIKMHDWWIVILAFLTEADIVFVNDPLVLYRQHDNNAIGVKNLSASDRIRFNVKRMIRGEIKAAKKTNIESPRLQAKEAYKTQLGGPERRDFIKQFYEIGSRNKVLRICFYIRHFHHVYRLWWMLLWV